MTRRRYTYMPTNLWNTTTFRNLTTPAQHLLLLAYTAPGTNQAGILDWRPNRIAALTNNNTTHNIETAAKELTTTGHLTIDDNTEEAAILGWFHTTLILKQPFVAMNAINLLNDVTSTHVRQAVINQLHELNRHQPPLAGLQTEHAQEFLTNNPEK